MVVDSKYEKDDFQVHFCYNFTPNFANPRSMEMHVP